MDRTTTVSLNTGRTMPLLGLGTWELTDHTAAAVEHALAIGYRMIDTAVDYGSQEGIGEALARTNVPRGDVYLVAKVEEDDDAYRATRRYLAEMKQEYADLMLIHRPPDDGVGEQLWEGLVRARDEGLTRDIGVSNYSIEQMETLIERVGETPVVNQIEWTPFGWSPDMLAWCDERRVVIQAYSPLTRTRRLDDDALARIADDARATPAQVMLRWAMGQGVVPLPKANRLEHQDENLGAFEVELDDEARERLDGLNEAWSSLGGQPAYL